MAFLDETALNELWERIGEVFARKAEAIGSLVLSGTSLIASKVDGESSQTIDLGDTFATDTEAAAADSLAMSGTSLTLANCDGVQKSSIDLATNLDPRYGGTLAISGQSLSLKSKSGTSLNSVTLPTTDTQPIYDYVKQHYAASVAVSLNADGKLTVALYNGEGTKISDDYVYIPTAT